MECCISKGNILSSRTSKRVFEFVFPFVNIFDDIMKFTILMIAISVIYAFPEVQTSPIYGADSKDQSLKGQGLASAGQDPKPDGRQEQSSQSSNDQSSTPKVNRTNHRIYPMFKPRLFEGDIIVDEYQDKNAVPWDFQRWHDGVIYYEINSNISPKIKQNLKKAMDSLSKNTCLRFRPRTTQRDYIHIYSGPGCWSHLGRRGGEQQISLKNTGCKNYGTVVHELLHAVGFFHEQNRSDRDDYVKINWKNIKTEHSYNFKKYDPDKERRFTPFDYDSVMLYGPSAFSIGTAATHPTISARKKGVVLKEVRDKVPSESDFKRVNMLYQCPQK